MSVKQIVNANSGMNGSISRMDRRAFLKTLSFAGAAALTSRFASMPLFAQDAKSVAKIDLDQVSIKPNGDFSITGGSQSVVGEKIFDAVTNKGDWKITEAYLVNNDVYVLRFKFGLVMISDKSYAVGYKAYPNELQEFKVLEPGKGEAAKVLVNGETIVARIVGPKDDKQIKLETVKTADIGIMSGQATGLK